MGRAHTRCQAILHGHTAHSSSSQELGHLLHTASQGTYCQLLGSSPMICTGGACSSSFFSVACSRIPDSLDENTYLAKTTQFLHSLDMASLLPVLEKVGACQRRYWARALLPLGFLGTWVCYVNSYLYVFSPIHLFIILCS